MIIIAFIYQLMCLCGCNGFYIGSTIQTLNQRFTKHKYDCKKKDSILYRHMKKVGSNNFTMKLLAKIKINTLFVEELRMHETEYYDAFLPTLNERRPYLDDDDFDFFKEEYTKENKENRNFRLRENYNQHKEEIREKMKTYRNNNRQKINEQCKSFRINNKEKHTAIVKRYQEKNKDLIKERGMIYYHKHKHKHKEKNKLKKREYRKNNQEKISNYNKLYRQKNKDKINAQRRERNRLKKLNELKKLKEIQKTQ